MKLLRRSLLAAVFVSLGLNFANAADSSDASDDISEPLTLALKTIRLSQGQGGLETWRLKATWANMLREDGKIIVQKPYLTYFMNDEKSSVMYVTSEQGDVDQKTQVMRFMDNVSVTKEDTLLKGPLLIYNGTESTMTMPDGGDLTGATMSGSAKVMVWDMKNNRIDATGDVDVYFEAKALEDPAVQAPESSNTQEQ